MKLSVITALYNCLPLTQAMLDSLRATLPRDLEYEIVFIDDGSTDGTREWLGTLDAPDIRVLLNERNLGYAGANNRGAAIARGEFLALLNNDLVLTPGWLEPMLQLFAHSGLNAGLVGNVQYAVATGALDHAGIFFDEHAKPAHLRTLPDTRRPYHEVAAATGACVVLRRDVFQQLGGFDEVYRNGGEDVDLCLRLRRHGLRVYVALTSAIRHHVSASVNRKLRDEENTCRLVRTWRDEIATLAAPAWCRHYLHECWEAHATPLPELLLDVAHCLRHPEAPPPARIIAAVQEVIDRQLAHWEFAFAGKPGLPVGHPHAISII
jgi:GT2 family glycosyltransferase